MKRILLFWAVILCGTQVFGGTLLVPSGGYTTIQTAINDANNGDTIIVAQGIYFENIDFSGKALTLRSTDPNDPDIVAATIIDGSKPNDPNIASVVTFTNNEGPNSVLSGFTIRRGTGQSDPCGASWYWKGTDGGGVFCREASPTITKNVFRDCVVGYGGGGIYCHYQASPLISENTFLQNYAGWYGGGVFARLNCSPTISNNVFKYNQCLVLGGAIYLADHCYSKVTGNRIEGNISTHLSGGGIYYFVYSAPIIANNFFINNTSKVSGSGIMASSNSTGWIINNVFQDNKLTQATTYGAVLGIYTNPIIANNIIADNQGNGIWVEAQANPTIHNNNVWNCVLTKYAGTITDLTGINGNISAQSQIGPQLPEPLTSYELHPNSPCIDTGSDSHLPPSLLTDYDGSTRSVGPAVDIGPQEYHMTAVPKDHPTIQQAINLANTGDEIIVLPGFYQENLNFLGKNLTLRSLNPIDVNCVENTILDGNDFASCITLNSGEDKSSIIAGLTIQNGYGEFGGGIYIADNYGATILYNFIHDNEADRYGGGIDARHVTDTVIEYNRIWNNHASNGGGGIHLGARAVCRIFRNYIAYNETNFARQGGGIYIYNFTDVEILENEICHNWSSSGGGLYAWMAKGSIERNHIWDNYGNAVGGGIALHPDWDEPFAVMHIANNLIEGNRTGSDGRGGGIYLLQGKTAVINNTITGNTAPEQSGSGIALEAGAYADIANNIIADNLGGSGIHLDMPADPNNLIEPNCVANDLWNNQGGEYSGELADQNGINGNISDDPCFVYIGYTEDNNTPDPNDDYFIRGNYRISFFSPCRDTGDANYAPATDVVGNNRPYFDAVDIGAYELQGYDMSGTGMVDYTDIALMAASWLNTEGPLLMDLDGSGIVDGRDFALLAQGWMR